MEIKYQFAFSQVLDTLILDTIFFDIKVLGFQCFLSYTTNFWGWILKDFCLTGCN